MRHVSHISTAQIIGSLVITDTYNNNELITVTQVEGSPTCIITFSFGSPVKAEAPTFQDALQYIDRRLEESYLEWEQDQNELNDMNQ
jgi:hypothetical protein